MEKWKVLDVDIYKDGDDLFLWLEYEKEDDDKISKIVIPKVKLNLYNKPNFNSATHEVNIGLGVYLPMKLAAPITKNGKLGTYVTHYEELIKVKEKPPKEMTIEEIEKTLGHKVKIVGEKNIEQACSTCRHMNQLTGGCRLSCKNLEKWEAREV